MQTTVIRDLYFAQHMGPTHRFSERSPASDPPPHTHANCNCTTTVEERPAGEPLQVVQVIRLTEKAQDKWVEVAAFGRRLECTVLWNEPESGLPPFNSFASERAGLPPQTHHAYLWLDAEQPSLQIEITLKGHSVVDCLLTKLYVGNQVDTSKLLNGHMRSRIVHLAKLGPDDLWAYKFGFSGQEAMEVFPVTTGETLWHEWCDRGLGTIASLVPLLEDTTGSVDDVRAAVEGSTLPAFAAWGIPRFLDLLPRIRATELFRIASQMESRLFPPPTEKGRARA